MHGYKSISSKGKKQKLVSLNAVKLRRRSYNFLMQVNALIMVLIIINPKSKLVVH